MTPVPEPDGRPGSIEEKRAQWFLELSFFRDALFRSPPGKGGKGELADAVVLHDDVVLMTQVKAQSSARPPQVWAKGAIEDALGQLGYSHRMLVDGHIRALRSETLGQLPFDPGKYRNRWGLILLDQPVDPFDPEVLVPGIVTSAFPVQVYSLADFGMITERFDTAGDLINYMEMRHAFRSDFRPRVHEERGTLERVMQHSGDYFRQMRPDIPEDHLARTVEAIQRTGAGDFMLPPDHGYGQFYDDIIARVHDIDPSLPENTTTSSTDALPMLEELGWLTRARRVALGRSILEIASAARDGGQHMLCHFQRPRGAVFVYLACDLARSERAELLEALLLRAQAKSDCPTALGVATEPIGGGRSYDLVIRRERLASDLVNRLRTTEDPFGDDSEQLVP